MTSETFFQLASCFHVIADKFREPVVVPAYLDKDVFGNHLDCLCPSLSKSIRYGHNKCCRVVGGLLICSGECSEDGSMADGGDGEAGAGGRRCGGWVVDRVQRRVQRGWQ